MMDVMNRLARGQVWDGAAAQDGRGDRISEIRASADLSVANTSVHQESGVIGRFHL